MADKDHNGKVPRIIKMSRGDKGYGFNLHGERGVVGQFISAVDDGGPAQFAGLCIGDRVIEVNGVNVEAATHSQVVAKIKEGVSETTLLVVDKVTDDYLKQHSIPITAELAKSAESKAEISSEHSASDPKESDGVETVKEKEGSKDDKEVEEVGMSVEDYLLMYADNEEKPAGVQGEVNGEVIDSVDGAVPKDASVTKEAQEDVKESKEAEGKDSNLPSLELPLSGEKRVERKNKMTPPDDPPPTPPASAPPKVEPPSQSQPVSFEAPVAKEPVPKEPEAPKEQVANEPAKVAEESPGPPQPADIKLKMIAALPKPKRKEIKEKKGADWASRAAIFNDL